MEVEEKINGMQKYIPCLKLLIENLEKNPAKVDQLKKMQYLLNMLTKKNLSIKLEILNKCEVVLKKMYSGDHNQSQSQLPSSDRNGETNVKEVVEDSQTSFGEAGSSNGASDLNGQVDSNGCQEKEENAEAAEESSNHVNNEENVEKSNAVEKPEKDDDGSNSNGPAETENELTEENVQQEAMDDVEKAESQPAESPKPSDTNGSAEDDKADESLNGENDGNETTEILQISCELEKSAIESEPSSQNIESTNECERNEQKIDEETTEVLTEQNSKYESDHANVKNNSALPDAETSSDKVEHESIEKEMTEPGEETTELLTEQDTKDESDQADLKNNLASPDVETASDKFEHESTEPAVDKTDCNNDDCDMEIDEEITNTQVKTVVDPMDAPPLLPTIQSITSVQTSTESTSNEPVKPKAGVVDLTSDDSDSETSKTDKVAAPNPTTPVMKPSAVYLPSIDKSPTPVNSTVAVPKSPVIDPLKDPLASDKSPTSTTGPNIATIDLLDSDSDDESANKAKTAATPAKMPTPKPAEKPMFTIASVQSINNTHTEKRQEVEKTLIGVVKTAQSTIHHTVPQKHNAAVRVHLDKFISDLMYEKNRVNLCLQKLQAVLPIDMYRQVKRVIQTFCSEPVHDPSLPAPSPFCHRIKVYPEKLQFVMRTLFYYNASISVVGYKLYSLDKKPPGRPVINQTASTQTRTAQSPATPRVAPSPTTPRAGPSPTSPRAGPSPTTPKSTPTRPGTVSQPIKPGQSPITPRPGLTISRIHVQNSSSKMVLLATSPNKSGIQVTPQNTSPQKLPVIRPVQQKTNYVSPQQLPKIVKATTLSVPKTAQAPSQIVKAHTVTVPAISSIKAAGTPRISVIPTDDLLAPMKTQSVSPDSLQHHAQVQAKAQRRKRRNDDDDDDDDENYVPQGYFSDPEDAPPEDQSDNTSRRTSLQRASKARCQKYLELERSIDDETYIRAAEATFAKVRPQKSTGTPVRKAVKRIRPPRPKKDPLPVAEPEPEPPSDDEILDDENDADYKESGAESADDSEPSSKRRRSGNDVPQEFEVDEDNDDCEPPPELNTKVINYGKNITKAYHCRSQYVNRCLICHEKLHIRRIISHYVRSHPEREVYISRITKGDLMKLQSETMCFGFLSGTKSQQNQYVAHCIFCQQEHTLSVEKWWEHYTRHTGEYEYSCSACGTKRSARQQLTRHVNIECTLKDKNPTVICPDEFDPNTSRIDAYVCLLCRYIQLRIEPLIKHLNTEHGFSINPYEIPEGSFQMINLFRVEHNYYDNNEYTEGGENQVSFQQDADDMSFMIANMLATVHGGGEGTTDAASKSLMDSERSQSPEMIIPEVVPPIDLIKSLSRGDTNKKVVDELDDDIEKNLEQFQIKTCPQKVNSLKKVEEKDKNGSSDIDTTVANKDSGAPSSSESVIGSEAKETSATKQPEESSEIVTAIEPDKSQNMEVSALVDETTSTLIAAEKPSENSKSTSESMDVDDIDKAVVSTSSNIPQSEESQIEDSASGHDEPTNTLVTTVVEESAENSKPMAESMDVDDTDKPTVSTSSNLPPSEAIKLSMDGTEDLTETSNDQPEPSTLSETVTKSDEASPSTELDATNLSETANDQDEHEAPYTLSDPLTKSDETVELQSATSPSPDINTELAGSTDEVSKEDATETSDSTPAVSEAISSTDAGDNADNDLEDKMAELHKGEEEETKTIEADVDMVEDAKESC